MLAWDKKVIQTIFPDWYTDSKRVLAVKGTGEDFNTSMIAIYRNLAENMPANGMQIVMFTHQDPGVWAELTMILWSAGLHVTAAWNIATETESGGLKEGNYVQRHGAAGAAQTQLGQNRRIWMKSTRRSSMRSKRRSTA